MYAMTGKLISQKGKRPQLVTILREAAEIVRDISECKMYVVCEDTTNENAVWVFEAWDDQQAHDNSLQSERTRNLISQAKPLLAAAPDGAELTVIGGHGI